MSEITNLPLKEEETRNLVLESVKLIQIHLGGAIKEEGEVISLTDWNFEGRRKASFSLTFIGRYFPQVSSSLFAEFTSLRIGNRDILNDSDLNPREARFFVPVGRKESECLQDVLEKLRSPLSSEFCQAVDCYAKVGSPEADNELVTNHVLITRLRKDGVDVADPRRPRIRILFPVCLELLAVDVHEFMHESDDFEVAVEEWLQSAKLSDLLSKETNEEKGAKIREKMRQIAAINENRSQKRTLTWMGPVLRIWKPVDYGKRLKQIDKAFRDGKYASGLKGIEDKELGGIKH